MKITTLPHELIYSGELILVNAKHSFKEHFANDTLKPVISQNPGVLLKNNVVERLASVMNEINGWEKIVAVSGWRSLVEQKNLYAQSVQENGKDFTEKYVAIPGHSEHQTGLAVDLALKRETIDFIRPDFPYMGICQRFREKSILHGFIERYPRHKENITGIAHEPWHFRYVGMPHSAIMTKHGLCLEEYIGFIKAYRYKQNPYLYGKVSVSYLEASKKEKIALEHDGMIHQHISGNNIDGFIITEWSNL